MNMMKMKKMMSKYYTDMAECYILLEPHTNSRYHMPLTLFYFTVTGITHYIFNLSSLFCSAQTSTAEPLPEFLSFEYCCYVRSVHTLFLLFH